MIAPRFTIREAEPGDGGALARLHIDVWRAAYVGLLPTEVLDELSVPDRERAWDRILYGEHPDPGTTWVADSDDELIGFASSGAARDEIDVPLELYALYVRADLHGTGVATPLLDAAIGDATAYLWVLDGNARAIRFYEKRGFRLDGAVQDEDIRDTTARERRMVRRAS